MDGNSTREEYFSVPGAPTAKADLDALLAKATVPDAPPPVDASDDQPVTPAQLSEIAQVMAKKLATQKHLTAFKREQGLSQRESLTQGQAREFLRMAYSGEVVKYDPPEDA